MLKSNLIKSNYRVLRKNKVDTQEALVFGPDYSTTVIAAKMSTNSNENSVRFAFEKQNKHILSTIILVQNIKIRQ
jgi:hypothetical protein